MHTEKELAAMTAPELAKLLGDRERLFVREYLVDLNGTAAAQRAHYSPKSAASTASRLLRKPEVAAYRDRLMQEAADAIGLSRASVLTGLHEIYQRCMDKKPVLEWDSAAHAWVPSGDWEFDAKGALRALEQLSGLLGLKAGEAPDEPEGYEDELPGGERQF